MKRLLFFLIPLVIVSCAQKEKDVLVRVNGSTLTKEEFEKYIPANEYAKLSDEKIREFCDNWVDQEVVYLEAMKQGVDKEDSIKIVLEEYKKNLVAMELVRREFGGGKVTEVEVRDYFEQHKNEFLYAVKLGQIVLSSLESATSTLQEIKAGADFFKLARERSLTRLENPEDPKVVTDYLPRGTIADFGIEEAVFKLKPGEVSSVIPYIQGTYLIVKMIDKKQRTAQVKFDDYSSAIYNYLMTKQYQDFLGMYVDSLRTQYKITIDLSPLKR